MAKRRKYVVLVRRGTPKQVNVNGRTFNANFKPGKRSELPANITFAKHKRQKAKKRVPAWLNSIDRRKHARKLARNAAATKKAIKKIRTKKTKKRMGGRGIADIAKTIATNPYAQEIGKRLLTKGIGYLPKLFKKGTSRIKNKHLRRIAQSDIAEDIVNRGTKRLLTRSNDLIGGL